jgi:hypothetical protein
VLHAIRVIALSAEILIENIVRRWSLIFCFHMPSRVWALFLRPCLVSRPDFSNTTAALLKRSSAVRCGLGTGQPALSQAECCLTIDPWCRAIFSFRAIVVSYEPSQNATGSTIPRRQDARSWMPPAFVIFSLSVTIRLIPKTSAWWPITERGAVNAESGDYAG